MRYVVEVHLKPEVSDPEGAAILQAARALGFDFLSDVRVGKSFEIEVKEGTEEKELEVLSDKLLVNPVVETFRIRRDDD
ncbi:MAG: phosphoribosylformylglycinamidine synthase, purS protein [Candidatus Hydrogenedentota bacterium]|nr:MAG: phosphoribosylformylglycinamidine synthase, purS protein [Candidatus Hydrogenedentota bacterium]